MPATVLVIEDDQDLGRLLEYNLRVAGYRVSLLDCLKGAMDRIEAVSPDLILLDVMLPDGDGFDFCKQIRARPAWAKIPILFLTARSEERDRVLGLEIGGDDYITKPFSTRELVARVRAHLRRGEADAAAGRSGSAERGAGALKLDPDTRRASLHGRQLKLTATEFRLLEVFLSHPGKVFSREKLLRLIWGENHYVTPRNVDVHIRRLRERIEESPNDPKWIQTVRGFGYRFEVPV